MKKTAAAAVVCAGLALGGCAGGVGVNYDMHRAGGSSIGLGGPPPPSVGTLGGVMPVAGSPRYGMAGPSGRRGCPPGMRPMGADGCAGQAVSDRSQLAQYDVPAERARCRPGTTQWVWANGIVNGRPGRWKIHQTCRRGMSGGSPAAAYAGPSGDEDPSDTEE